MSEITDYIQQAATARGIDPNVALKVYQNEGAGGYVGDSGTSFGPFQLHYGQGTAHGYSQAGMGNDFTAATGLDARDRSTWKQQVDFALDQAKQKGWSPWYGARRAGITSTQGLSQPVQATKQDKGQGMGLFDAASWSPIDQGLLVGTTANKPASSGPDWSTLSPSLLALGAGLLQGGNWREGLGAGLSGVYKTQELAATKKATAAQQDFNKLMQLSNLGLRQQSVETAKAGQERLAKADTAAEQGAFSAIQAGSGSWSNIYNTLASPDWGRGTAFWEHVTGGGKIEDAQAQARMILAAALNKKDLNNDEARTLIPQASDKPEARVQKMQNIAAAAAARTGRLGQSTGQDYTDVANSYLHPAPPQQTETAAPSVLRGPAQQQATTAPTNAPSFASEDEAAKAGLQPGTRVIINGVPGTWQ